MRVQVKICGITNLRDAKSALRNGADYLGFNFYPKSPRYIAPAKAARIIRQLPRALRAVGVFVDSPEQEIARIAEQAGLFAVQLHGSETPRAVRELARTLPVWKALRVRANFDPGRLAKWDAAQAILLDAYRAGIKGGTGKIFDWQLAREAAPFGRIVLAGGLTPENVAEAVRTARPFAVDVASGVEQAPGKKDTQKMRAFIRAVKTIS